MNPTVAKVQDYCYIPDQLLGKGSFGSVYLGYHTKDPETPLAIKQIPLIPNQESEIVECCRKESQILKGLNNKNIVKLYAALRTAKNVYMVYEYCDEGDLSKLRKESKTGYLSEAQTLVFMRHICNGYKDMLGNSVIHRDLKPSNILVNDGEAKIADFGAAKFINPLKTLAMTQGLGTPLYISPENFTKGIYDEKTDVWSFGIMVYELLYGHTPWIGNNIFDLFNNHILKEELTFPEKPKRSKSIKGLIRRMLVVDPEKRINWDEVFEDLATFDDFNVEEERKNLGRSIIGRKKKVIGNLYDDDKEWKKKAQERKKEEEKYEKEQQQIGFENTIVNKDSNKKKTIETKENLQKKTETSKSLKNLIFFYRNLSNFFGLTSVLLNMVFEAKLLQLKEFDFKKINELLIYFEHEAVWRTRQQFEVLKDGGLLKKKELDKLETEVENLPNTKDFNPNKGNSFKQLKELLKDMLRKNKEQFFKSQKFPDFNDFQQDFFELICFFVLIANAEEPKNVLKEFEEEETSQMFYKFYDKYEHMENEEFELEIKNGLKMLQL